MTLGTPLRRSYIIHAIKCMHSAQYRFLILFYSILFFTAMRMNVWTCVHYGSHNSSKNIAENQYHPSRINIDPPIFSPVHFSSIVFIDSKPFPRPQELLQCLGNSQSERWSNQPPSELTAGNYRAPAGISGRHQLLTSFCRVLSCLRCISHTVRMSPSKMLRASPRVKQWSAERITRLR